MRCLFLRWLLCFGSSDPSCGLPTNLSRAHARNLVVGCIFSRGSSHLVITRGRTSRPSVLLFAYDMPSVYLDLVVYLIHGITLVYLDLVVLLVPGTNLVYLLILGINLVLSRFLFIDF